MSEEDAIADGLELLLESLRVTRDIGPVAAVGALGNLLGFGDDDLESLGDGPDVQLWPHLHGTDAMYLALIRRT